MKVKIKIKSMIFFSTQQPQRSLIKTTKKAKEIKLLVNAEYSFQYFNLINIDLYSRFR
jgi:hypothetical protein